MEQIIDGIMEILGQTLVIDKMLVNAICLLRIKIIMICVACILLTIFTFWSFFYIFNRLKKIEKKN